MPIYRYAQWLSSTTFSALRQVHLTTSSFFDTQTSDPVNKIMTTGISSLFLMTQIHSYYVSCIGTVPRITKDVKRDFYRPDAYRYKDCMYSMYCKYIFRKKFNSCLVFIPAANLIVAFH
jgi:hypothetical protein